MILGSYANLYATEEAITNQEKVQEKLVPIKPPELPAVNLPLLPQDTQSKGNQSLLQALDRLTSCPYLLPLDVADRPVTSRIYLHFMWQPTSHWLIGKWLLYYVISYRK